jgi:hypothetical protein
MWSTTSSTAVVERCFAAEAVLRFDSCFNFCSDEWRLPVPLPRRLPLLLLRLDREGETERLRFLGMSSLLRENRDDLDELLEAVRVLGADVVRRET